MNVPKTATSTDTPPLSGLYTLTIRTEPTLYSWEDFGYIDSYEGNVRFSPNEAPPERAGAFRATVIRGDDARSDGFSIPELWD